MAAAGATGPVEINVAYSPPAAATFAAPAPDDPYWSEVRERRGYGRECPPGSRPTDERATHLSRLSAALGANVTITQPAATATVEVATATAAVATATAGGAAPAAKEGTPGRLDAARTH